MDDRLRALERAARADPSDRAAGWAFVAALDQAGDEVGAWRERCRLAWAGDARAWTEVDRPVLSGVRALGPVVSRRFEDGSVRLVAARPDVIVVESGSELLGLDPTTLESRWRRDSLGSHLWTPFGPDVVAPSAASELVVVDARTGVERRRRELPHVEGGWWPCGRTADRLVAAAHRRLGAADDTLLVTSEDASELLEVPRGGPARGLTGGHRIEQLSGLVRGFALASSGAAWEIANGLVVDADPRHALVDVFGDTRRAQLVSLTTGVPILTWTGWGHHLGHDAVVRGETDHLIVHGRDDGAERWRLRFPPRRGPPAQVIAARDVLVIGHRRRGGATIGGLDLATGGPLWAVQVDGLTSASVQLALSDRAVVAAVTNRQQAHLVRITAPEAPSIP